MLNPFLSMDDETLCLVDPSDIYTIAAEACGTTNSLEFDTLYETLCDRHSEERARRFGSAWVDEDCPF
jgi:hypothetical protein